MCATREATVRGRLYDLPFGFPALLVPEADIQATGTTDYLTDVELQSHAQTGPQESSPNWGTVHGELLSFDDPEERLPAFDKLEGFHPGGESFYKRVLIPATLAETGTRTIAWAYVVESASGVYLPGGHWPTP
ncbi:MAG: gamma-glutamylcyclotransferase [Actinomycetota bacterium]|nr:gamma-glutamylcyclotransferase [Actinomycetota bacterium]